MVAGVYVVLQVIEGNVLVPMVMRNSVGISPLLVLLSLLVGAAVGGFIGAFLAVPVVASIELALTRLQARDVPVAQDTASIESEESTSDDATGLPDGISSATAGGSVR